MESFSVGGISNEELKALLYSFKKSNHDFSESFLNVLLLLNKLHDMAVEELYSNLSDLDYWGKLSESTSWKFHYSRIFHLGPLSFLKNIKMLLSNKNKMNLIYIYIYIIC
jgi:hypothetical protein